MHGHCTCTKYDEHAYDQVMKVASEWQKNVNKTKISILAEMHGKTE